MGFYEIAKEMELDYSTELTYNFFQCAVAEKELASILELFNVLKLKSKNTEPSSAFEFYSFKNNYLIQGPKVEEFEKSFKNYIKCIYCAISK